MVELERQWVFGVRLILNVNPGSFTYKLWNFSQVA